MGAETEYKVFVVVTAVLVMAFFLTDISIETSEKTSSGNAITSNVILSNEKTFSTQECYELGGRLVSTVAGQRCASYEILLGNVAGYLSPTICCKEEV